MPNTIAPVAETEKLFLDAYARGSGHTLNGTNARVRAIRARAIEAFAALGFPLPRTEEWKYTSLAALLTGRFEVDVAVAPPVVDESAIARHRIPGLDAHLLVLVNGKVVPALCDLDDVPDGVTIGSIAKAAESGDAVFDRSFGAAAALEDDVFVALNTAFVRDGCFVHVPSGVVLERPVHVLSFLAAGDDQFFQPRLLLVADANASVRVIHTQISAPRTAHRANIVTEVIAGPAARLDYDLIQYDSAASACITTTKVYQEANSVVSTTTFTLDGALVRNNLAFLPDAEHCESNLYGLFLGRGGAHVDNHTLVDHASPNCVSNELYKGILDDEATGVFNGKVLVRRDAQKTNAYQSNKSLVLTDTARMYAKPELEIYADDVKCSHGATSGQLDKDALFYLRQRGISEQRARRMLLAAFTGDVLESVKDEVLRNWISDRLQERLEGQLP